VRLGIRIEPQLEEDLLHVGLDGALGDEEARSDCLVRQPFGNELENFSLALGQLFERILAASAADEARDDRRSPSP